MMRGGANLSMPIAWMARIADRGVPICLPGFSSIRTSARDRAAKDHRDAARFFRNLQELFEFALVWVVHFDHSRGYLVIPAVKPKGSFSDPTFYGWMSVQMRNLFDDIQLA